MKIPFPKEQILARMQFENPWWNTGKTESYFSKMKKRDYFQLFHPLVKELGIKRAIVLMGPRRVGKTVLIFHTIQALIDEGIEPTEICYLSIETPIYNSMGLEELLHLLFDATGKDKNKRLFIFFDEIQYLKDWEIHLKSLVDSYHNIKFIVSGSAAAALKIKSDESGAGRFTDFILPPLTFCEYLSLKNCDHLIKITQKLDANNKPLKNRRDFVATDIHELNKHFVEYINFGGYPEVSLSPTIQKDPGRYLRNDIIDKVLMRDLPLLYGIEDIQELNSLFNYIAYNTGCEMSLDSIANSSGVSKNTIKKYITYLQAAFLIRVVNRVSESGGKFKRANFFKIYLTNPSLRSALFAPLPENDPKFGLLVETAIYSQWQHANNSQDFLYYARWNSGEVDMVHLNRLSKPAWAIEIKWSNKPYTDYSQLKNISVFCKTHNIKTGLVTTLDIAGYKNVNTVDFEYAPSSTYCYKVGRNIVDSKIEYFDYEVNVVK